jgi:hypothetical protein
MEISVHISYNGYRAEYKIDSFNSMFFHAELINYSGLLNEKPPFSLNFIKIDEQVIASSDTITVARELSEKLDH